MTGIISNQTNPESDQANPGEVTSFIHRQQRCNIFGQTSSQLLQHPLFSDGTRDRFTFQRQVMHEAGNELIRVHRELLESLVQVEQIAVLRRCSKARSFVPNSSSGS